MAFQLYIAVHEDEGGLSLIQLESKDALRNRSVSSKALEKVIQESRYTELKWEENPLKHNTLISTKKKS